MWTSSVIENTHIIHDYMANSLPRDSDQMRRIQAAVKKAGMFVVLGFSERDGGKLRPRPRKPATCMVYTGAILTTSVG